MSAVRSGPAEGDNISVAGIDNGINLARGAAYGAQRIGSVFGILACLRKRNNINSHLCHLRDYDISSQIMPSVGESGSVADAMIVGVFEVCVFRIKSRMDTKLASPLSPCTFISRSWLTTYLQSSPISTSLSSNAVGKQPKPMRFSSGSHRIKA